MDSVLLEIRIVGVLVAFLEIAQQGPDLGLVNEIGLNRRRVWCDWMRQVENKRTIHDRCSAIVIVKFQFQWCSNK